jgi:RNA polymerase sigma-70 factor (ECF subfamily)
MRASAPLRVVPSNAHVPDLVEAVRAGDAAALGAVYDAHAPALHRVAFRLTGSAADAEDVVHDLFVGLPEALARYEDRGQLGAWLARAAVRLCLMRLRGARRRREAPLIDEHAAAAGAEATAARADLARAVGALPASLRAVFVLKVVEGYPHDDVAAALGITSGASRVRLARALRLLREALR